MAIWIYLHIFAKSKNHNFKSNPSDSYYSFEIKTTSKEIIGSCLIQRRKGESSLYIGYDLGAMEGEANIPQAVTSVELQGQEFKNCIVFYVGKNLNSNSEWERWNNPVIDKFIISRDYGLIYFKLKDGEEYFRNFKKVDPNQY